MTGPPHPTEDRHDDTDGEDTTLDGALSRRSVLQSSAAVGAAGAIGRGTGSVAAQDGDVDEVNVLVFSVTDAWRHDVIEYANQQLEGLDDRIAEETGADSVTIEVIDDPNGDASAFPSSVSELETYDVVVWNSTTGSPLDYQQQQAFEEYVRNGGGYAGIHAASDTHYDWNFYEELVGALFQSHPAVQEAEIAVTDDVHPSTRHLPSRWTVTDEWYNYNRSPRGDVHVLATLDEDSYNAEDVFEGEPMEDGHKDHPIAWCQEIDDGRSWYTGRGHTEGAFDEEPFLEHVLQGILWAGGFTSGDASGTDWSAYDPQQLTTDVNSPVAVEVAPDGRVFVSNLERDVQIVDPETGQTTTALSREFYGVVEDGGGDLAFDPDFEENGYVYFYYAPTNDALDSSADGPYNVVSRFTVEGDQMDPDSEVEIIRIPTQRDEGALAKDGSDMHVGGGLEFGPEGNLYISIGDNMTPFQSDGFAPLDEGSDPNWMDARGSAGDTSDLRGSILRINPQEDGSYTVPDDNMFTAAQGYGSEVDAGTVRPEIYAMGFRNPYRFDVDPETGWLFVGEMGPDSREWGANRGPLGMVTYHRIKEPAFFGWPFVRYEYPYYEYDFSTNQSGQPFDPNGPTNDSRHNDGLTQLPPVETESTLFFAPTDWQRYLNEPWDGPWETPDEAPHPQVIDTGPIGGPVVRLDQVGDGGLPYYFDGKWMFAGWNGGTIKLATLDDDGDLLDIEPFLPDLDLDSPIDMSVGPDGVLHVADWGEGEDGRNPSIYRIEHTPDVEVPPERIELEGEIGGWQGVSPDSIAGETNPTLDLEPGEDYLVEWTNTDGIGHNFAIRNAAEDVLHSTDLFREQGGTQTVEFTATEEMDHYVCQPHVNAMRGSIGGEGPIDLPIGDPKSEVTVQMRSDIGFIFESDVVHVEPGGTVTWELQSGHHDTTAYHPDTGGAEQRIPDDAEPWASDLLSNEGETFEKTFYEPGVYDYRCTPHEEAGMVGVVVVGWPDPSDQPALRPFSSSVPSGASEVLSDLHDAIEPVLEQGADFEVDGIEPQRPDGEDMYYDVNGDGAVSNGDITDFFSNQHVDPWDSRPDLFDFSGDGDVSQSDVIELFHYVN